MARMWFKMVALHSAKLKAGGKNAVFGVIFQIAKEPRPALCAAPYHDAVGGGLFEDGGGFLRRSDVAVDPDGDVQTTFGLGNQIISRFALIHLRACASVDGKGGDAAIFGDAGDGR